MQHACQLFGQRRAQLGAYMYPVPMTLAQQSGPPPIQENGWAAFAIATGIPQSSPAEMRESHVFWVPGDDAPELPHKPGNRRLP